MKGKYDYVAYIYLFVLVVTGVGSIQTFNKEKKEKKVHCDAIKATIAKDYNTSSEDDVEMRTFLMIGCE